MSKQDYISMLEDLNNDLKVERDALRHAVMSAENVAMDQFERVRRWQRIDSRRVVAEGDEGVHAEAARLSGLVLRGVVEALEVLGKAGRDADSWLEG